MNAATAIAERLGFFVKAGRLEELPTPWQVKVGWLAMLPITLSESERERARSRSTVMGQVPIRVPLQILYNPRQIAPDTGIRQGPEQIVRHLLSVYHEDAFLGYDLQLLQSHPEGLRRLRDEAAKVVDGRTLWAPYLKQLCGWPGYHARLVELGEAAERFQYPDPLDVDPRFASLVGFAKFCCTMPKWPARGFYGFDLGRIAKTAAPTATTSAAVTPAAAATEKPGELGAHDKPGELGAHDKPGELGAHDKPGELGAHDKPGELGAHDKPGELGAHDGAFVDRHAPWMTRLLHRWFRADVQGLDALPDGPFVAVGNHSGAVMIPDALVWVGAYHTARRRTPLLILAHDLMFDRYPKPLARALAKLGVVRARRETAREALRRGHAVQIYPGGDYDACRSFSRRHEIVFAGRKGYVELAREAGVPIVPVVSVGGHEALVVLWDGALLARALGLDRRFRLKVLPLSLSIPWGLWLGPLPGYLPLPTKISVRVLPPVWPGEPGTDAETTDAVDREVRLAMQRATDEMAKARRFPWLG
jgi:1-acyl-sn-glycerol-3-phosphate acyltransferase